MGSRKGCFINNRTKYKRLPAKEDLNFMNQHCVETNIQITNITRLTLKNTDNCYLII